MDDYCRCRMRCVRFAYPDLHLCALVCPVLEHSNDELDYLISSRQPEPLQLRLF